MTGNGFFCHVHLTDIQLHPLDVKNADSVTFFNRFQLFSEANSLTLSQVRIKWCYWKFSNVSFSFFSILWIPVLVCNSCGIYRRCYFCLSRLPKIKKESTANIFYTTRSRWGHKEPIELTVINYDGNHDDDGKGKDNNEQHYSNGLKHEQHSSKNSIAHS